MQRIEFNRIYFNVDESGYLNLLLRDEQDQQCLYFDGINFYYRNRSNKALSEWSLLNYNTNLVNLYINRITQDMDITFIQISNGDIFQIYSMFHDHRTNQQLTIFDETTKQTSTPMGISLYEAAVKRANEANEALILSE